jgi:tetratricopeptide (TPR) repeat protein
MARQAKKKDPPVLFAYPNRVAISAAVALAIVGGWFAFALAVSGVTRFKNPQTALSLAPSDSIALAAKADLLLMADPAKTPRAVEILAKKALTKQAINAKALRILGYVADAHGDRAKGLNFINKSVQLSRRDSYAQLWLIEHYAQANDTSATLRHYDVALKTKPDISAILYPRLSNAIGDIEIRAALLPYLRANRPWMSRFISHVIASEAEPAGFISLIIEAKGLPKSNVSQLQEQTVLSKLVNQKRFAEARQVYGFVQGSKASKLINPAFDESDRDGRFGAMGWTLSDNPNAGGGFIGKKIDGPPALSVFADSATTRTVAGRLLFLSPQSYRFSARLSRLESGDGGYLQFQLRCIDGENAVSVWNLNMTAKSGRSQIIVPTGCNVQMLDIIASGGEGQTGLEAEVEHINLMADTD